ncbi:MAG TPA: DNA gyrase inhibitor YacG [Vicinamibacterales bacterium]|nr:DNA gyrase inhibitor YacG [Vicinamibacterales bacterium]
MDQPVCVYCGRAPVDPEWRPFCSERCRMADLGRWLSGSYRVQGPPVPEHDAESGELPPGNDDNEHRDG